MEFEGQYLTFEEYEDLGGTLTKTPFNLLEFESRKQVDLRTQKRLAGLEEIPSEVKICIYHLIDKMKTYAESTSSAAGYVGSVASESTDGYSIKYNQLSATQIQDIIKSKKAEIDDLILNDLYGVIVNGEHVIYNGVK